MQNNVIDGSDTAEAQINPFADCGASEGNNNLCVTSGTAQWRGPQIWRNNVIRYVENAAVGACTEWSGNLIEYIRLSTDPTAHTNGIECLDEIPVNGITLSYNNVIRHSNNPNSNTPGGRWSIGLLNEYTPKSGSTAYVFDNVVYDTLQNSWAGAYPSGSGCCGKLVVFNNSSDGGPLWADNNSPLQCNSAFTACLFQNNHSITANTGDVSNCSENCTKANDLLESVATASSQGFSVSQNSYAYYPSSGAVTIGSGASLTSICSAISAANASAGAACLYDTTYGASYNISNHTAVTSARAALARPGTPSVGAYELSSSAVQPPTATSVLTK